MSFCGWFTEGPDCLEARARDGRIAGIGLAVAEALHATSMHVVRVARSLRARSSERMTDIPCDITKPVAVKSLVEEIVGELGVPDIVVNNAGIFLIKQLAETTYDDFALTLATNLTAPFLIAHALVPKMVLRGSGHLVTIGSISDYIGFPAPRRTRLASSGCGACTR